MKTEGLTDGQNEADSRFLQFCQTRLKCNYNYIRFYLHIVHFLFNFKAV